VLAGQLALVLAACALGAAALRGGGRLLEGRTTGAGGGGSGPCADPGAIERVLVAAALAAGFVALWTLALGLAGLDGSALALIAGPVAVWVVVWLALVETPSRLWVQIDRAHRPRTVALALAALATWLLARRLTTPAEMTVGAELVAWWGRLSSVAGGAAALAAIVLHRPAPGFDGIIYHLPEVVGFVQGGHAGALVHTNYALPVGNHPLTNEVLLAWLTGLSHGFVAATL